LWIPIEQFVSLFLSSQIRAFLFDSCLPVLVSLGPLSHVPVFLFSVELLCTKLGHLYRSETLASLLVDFSFVVRSSSLLKDLFFCRQEFSSPSGFIPGLETAVIDPASSCFSVFQYR
jgi:hypothetical protein